MMATSQLINIGGVPHQAGTTWSRSALRRAFGPAVPPSLALHGDTAGAVPIEAVAAHMARLGRAAIRAFDEHSELIQPAVCRVTSE
jgi:hypothetical protein